jgi:DNA modification methylase
MKELAQAHLGAAQSAKRATGRSRDRRCADRAVHSGAQRCGLAFRAQLIWVKNQFVIGMADYHHRFEPILYDWLPDAAHYFADDRTQDDVFEVDKPHVSDLHPTQKPIELIGR